MFEKKFRYDKMSPIMLILCSLSRITYIFRPSTEHVYVSPNIYWGILHWKAQVGCRESWMMLWDSSSSKRLSAQREGSNFNLETEGLMKQLSAWLQLNYSSTQEVSQLKSLTRYSSPPPFHAVSFRHKTSLPPTHTPTHTHTHTHTHTPKLPSLPPSWTSQCPPEMLACFGEGEKTDIMRCVLCWGIL